MAQRFPIFIDVGSVAPLVVGADQGLAAKIRLLAGFAPVVDLVTGMDLPPGELRHPQMRHITGVALQAADSLFRGRPLIIIETGDMALNTRLATIAREAGVPVNVPDCPTLCSFYLGAIVERDPVTVAISTGGFSPVLAQRLRARIEDMLPTGYGRLAIYLNRIRHRLRHLSAARRRGLQHQIIESDIGTRIIDGDTAQADSWVIAKLTAQMASMSASVNGSVSGRLRVIESGHDDPDHLQRPAAEAIRNADVIIHTQGESPAVLSLARREVELLAVGPRPQRRLADDRLARGLDVVILTDNGMKSAGSSGIPA